MNYWKKQNHTNVNWLENTPNSRVDITLWQSLAIYQPQRFVLELRHSVLSKRYKRRVQLPDERSPTFPSVWAAVNLRQYYAEPGIQPLHDAFGWNDEDFNRCNRQALTTDFSTEILNRN